MHRSAGSPRACGALGRFERDRVLDAAARMGAGLEVVHEDESSILLLDRAPIRWSGARSRGLGWVETDVWRERPIGDWRAAARLGLSGLATGGRRRFLHTSVSGTGRLYWREDGDATYFASRLDPLACTAPAPLSVDWDAWAAIVALRYPLGTRTPFAEIRRLGPFATLRRRRGRARVEKPTWAWAEVEPGAGLAGAADLAAEAIRDCLSPLPGGIECPLSGGRDSRLLCAVLAGDGRVARALTADDDEGEHLEERLAAPVAAELGIPQERLAGEATGFRRDWEERARRVEYEFVDHPWLVPLARRVDGRGLPVPDGFGIDFFVQSGRHFSTPTTLDNRRRRRASLALFEALRRYGEAPLALAEHFREPLLARTRDQFIAAVRPFEGHPSQNLLSLYATRAHRGISTYPTGLLGESATVVAPGANDAVVTATLRVAQREKEGAVLYRALYERLAPRAGRLPSTADTPRGGPTLPRRWLSDPALDFYRRTLADGPLAPHLSPELRSWLEHPRGGELSAGLRLGMEAVALLHAWWREYRGVLREADPTELAG